MPPNINQKVAAIANETLLTRQQVRDWFASHHPPEANWQWWVEINVADVIAQISQEFSPNE